MESATSWVEATMVRFRVPADFMETSFAGPRTATAINIGVRTVKMMNARLRTRWRYSRLMIKNVLRILASSYLTLNGVDEDLLERRFYEFELADASRLSGKFEQLLRIGTWSQLQFDTVSGIMEGLDQIFAIQELRRAVVLHDDAALSVTGLDLAQNAL